ncbi:MAG TPA: hypothetical protein VGG08_02960, partial [Solirubrobacteraceae bacterium]|jgi:hypothetical protein
VLFDSRSGAPFMGKLTSERLSAPADGWIAIGDDDASMGPTAARGECGEASWSLSFQTIGAELRHLSPELLYRTALPRTKLTSPSPLASFSGRFSLAGREPIELDGWPGMVGHNWGAEHAERWIWLHGCDFDEAPGDWLDVGIGRLALGGRLTPWAASGAMQIDGRRERLGGLLSRGTRVEESVAGATIELAGRGGLRVRAEVRVPDGAAAGWRYADPDGGEHDVVNCSVSALELRIQRRGEREPELVRSTDHGCAYELGMRERDHGVPIAPFPDGL